MIIGQLWYGWAPRGVEGINQEQIVAGSGDLSSRSHPLTQLVLPWCYHQKSESRGWLERNGVGVAFRRTPTGRDARGRLGAFFVHALVWKPGTMPARLLAGLWDAAIWANQPPAEPPAKLEPITSVAQLGLVDPPLVDRELVVTALAALLENLAGSHRSALDFPIADAYAVAARLAAVMPAKFGLMSFSSHEQQDRADAYDIVGGPSPGTGHVVIGSDSRPNTIWLRAAEPLLEAFEGNPQAGALVDAIAAQAGSLNEFAEGMHRWVAMEASLADPGTVMDPKDLSLIEGAPVLVATLLRDETAGGVIRSFIAERGAEVLVNAVRRAGVIGRFMQVLREVLSVVPPQLVVPPLSRLEHSLPVEARALAHELVERWRADQLMELSPGDAITLLQLLAAERAAEPVAVRIVEDLVRAPQTAAALMSSPSLPVDWRARAAAAHPAHVSRAPLVSAMIDERRFASTFVRGSGRAGLEALGAAIEEAPMSSALRCAERAAAHLSAPDDRIELLLPVILRLDAAERLFALNRLVPHDAPIAPEWTDLAITALVDTVLKSRDTRQVLPSAGGPAFTVGLQSTTSRIQTWRMLGQRIQDIGPEAIDAVMREILSLESTRDADAAVEIVVEAISEQAAGRPSKWLSAITAVARSVPEHEGLALRLARAGLRAGRGDRSEIALWAIWWIAGAIDRGSISDGLTRQASVARLPTMLRAGDIAQLEDFGAQFSRRSASARWLKRIEKDHRKRHEL